MKVMSFGLQGSSSVLMRVMNSAMSQELYTSRPEDSSLGDLPRGGPRAHGPLHRSVVVYMKDLLCYSPSLEQHQQDIREVLTIFREEKHFVKALECEFGRWSKVLLGHRASSAGLAVDPRKVAAVRYWPVPSSNVDLRRFIRLCNYYRRFFDTYVDS